MNFSSKEQALAYQASNKPFIAQDNDFCIWYPADAITEEDALALNVSKSWVFTAKEFDEILHMKGMTRVQPKAGGNGWMINIQSSTLANYLLNNKKSLPWSALR